MPSTPAPARLLADLAGVLERLSIRWYVFGAQAVLIWGRPRMATDVDQIRTVLNMLQQAIGQSDLVPVFEYELQRVGRCDRR